MTRFDTLFFSVELTSLERGSPPPRCRWRRRLVRRSLWPLAPLKGELAAAKRLTERSYRKFAQGGRKPLRHGSAVPPLLSGEAKRNGLLPHNTKPAAETPGLMPAPSSTAGSCRFFRQVTICSLPAASPPRHPLHTAHVSLQVRWQRRHNRQTLPASRP